MTAVKLSAVIITYNEQLNIGRCIDALRGIADEVLVLDSFSKDDTEKICRDKGARFEQHFFDGYTAQKNRANDMATHDCVLSLDADEVLSDELYASILAVKNNWVFDGYAMNRLTNYCGRWIHHSGWYPDRKLRLFDRRKARWEGIIHESLMLNGTSTRLRGDLLHYSYYTVEEHLERARKYAHISAEAMKARGKKGAWWRMWLSPVFKFFRNYVLKLGFLDGKAGFTICRIAALETYWKYRELAKLS